MDRILNVVRALGVVLPVHIPLAPIQAEPAPHNWPQRAVRLIVPLPPGGPTDIAARRLAERLAERWRQPVTVENRQGADGIPAATALAEARDDHTLLFSFAGIITVNPVLHDSLPYDSKDLLPIAPVLDNFIAIAASSSLNVSSLAGFTQVARSRPGELNWSALPGIPNYLFLALIKDAGLTMVRVGYRDFTPAYQDLHQARLHVVVAGVPNLLPHRDAGTARLLMVSSRQRAPQAPDVPTAAEAGFPDLTFDGTVGVYGRRGMPAPLIARIAADVRTITEDPTFRDQLLAIGTAPRAGTPEEFSALIEEQRARIAAIHRSSASGR